MAKLQMVLQIEPSIPRLNFRDEQTTPKQKHRALTEKADLVILSASIKTSLIHLIATVTIIIYCFLVSLSLT